LAAANDKRNKLPSADAEWISLAELLQLTGWSERTIRRKNASGELRSREVELAANGKPRREYDANYLPAEIQAKRLQYGLVKSPSSQQREKQLIRTMQSLEGAALEQAEHRLAVITPLIEYSSSGQRSGLSGIVKNVAAAHGQSERTIWNWWNWRSG